MSDKSKTRESVTNQLIDWAGCAMLMLAGSLSVTLLSIALAVLSRWVW